MIDWDSFKQQLQTHPNRTLGFVLGLAACLMLIWLVVAVQTSDTRSNRPVEQSGDSRLSGLRISLQAPDSAAAAEEVSAPAADSQESPDHTPAAAGTSDEAGRMGSLNGVLPTLLVMLALIGGLWYWVRRKTSPSDPYESDDEFYTLMGRGEVFPGQHIALLKVNGEHLLVSSGPRGAHVLRSYAPGEWEGEGDKVAGGGPGNERIATAKKGEANGHNGNKDWKSYLGRALNGPPAGSHTWSPSGGASASGADDPGATFQWEAETVNGKSGRLW